jgi:IMP cyclohydrolase
MLQHSSTGGRSGSVAVVPTSSASRPRSPYVASAVIRVSPSWVRSAAQVDTLLPSRSERVTIVAGPGFEAER